MNWLVKNPYDSTRSPWIWALHFLYLEVLAVTWLCDMSKTDLFTLKLLIDGYWLFRGKAIRWRLPFPINIQISGSQQMYLSIWYDDMQHVLYHITSTHVLPTCHLACASRHCSISLSLPSLSAASIMVLKSPGATGGCSARYTEEWRTFGVLILKNGFNTKYQPGFNVNHVTFF